MQLNKFTVICSRSRLIFTEIAFYFGTTMLSYFLKESLGCTSATLFVLYC